VQGFCLLNFFFRFFEFAVGVFGSGVRFEVLVSILIFALGEFNDADGVLTGVWDAEASFVGSSVFALGLASDVAGLALAGSIFGG